MILAPTGKPHIVPAMQGMTAAGFFFIFSIIGDNSDEVKVNAPDLSKISVVNIMGKTEGMIFLAQKTRPSYTLCVVFCDDVRKRNIHDAQIKSMKNSDFGILDF